MNSRDIYEDPEFPHGTKEGHERGCKGSQCPARREGGMSCSMAHIRYQGDYEYRKAIDAGEEWVEPALPERKVPLIHERTRHVRPEPQPEPAPVLEAKPDKPAYESRSMLRAERDELLALVEKQRVEIAELNAELLERGLAA